MFVFFLSIANYIGLWKSKHVFVENFHLQIPRGLIKSMAKCGDSTPSVKDVLGMDCDKCSFCSLKLCIDLVQNLY